MAYVEGLIYQDSGFVKGYMEYAEGEIIDVVVGSCPNPDGPLVKGVVIPLLTNCHTHLGDAIAYGRQMSGDLESLVAPPDGLKFRILRESTPEDLISAMHRAMERMLSTGTGTFIDFREEGTVGVELLTKSVSKLPIQALIMGRPKELRYSKEELACLLPMVDGIGLSSLTDWEYSEIEKIATEVKRKGKLLALHASERTHEDLDKILKLRPDFLVHMTYGSDSDFETLAALEIPIVLCLRSNIFFKNIPNIPKMLEKDVALVLGTDNAMFNSPNLFKELEIGFKLANRFGQVSPKEMFKMITLNLKKILNPKYYISLAPGTQSNFMVLDIPFAKPEFTIVNGVRPEQIKLINIGRTLWKNGQ
ncbi:amidohydrolase family protein [[Eubacterium] cellulosolvens]